MKLRKYVLLPVVEIVLYQLACCSKIRLTPSMLKVGSLCITDASRPQELIMKLTEVLMQVLGSYWCGFFKEDQSGRRYNSLILHIFSMVVDRVGGFYSNESASNSEDDFTVWSKSDLYATAKYA